MDQALPTQYPDLNTLFERMPGFAALQAGEQSRVASQNNASLQDAFSNEQNYLSQKRPLDLAALVSQNRSRDTQSDTMQLNNDFTKATQPGKIATTNADNSAKLSADHLSELEDFGSLVKQAAAQSKVAVGPGAKAAVVKRVLGSHLIDHPELDTLLTNAGDNLPQVLDDLGDSIFQGTKDYRKNQLKEEAENKRLTQQGNTQLEVARINAQGRVDARQAGAKAPPTDAELAAKMGYEKAAVYYDALADKFENEGNSDKAEMYRAKSSMMKMANERAKILAAQQAGAGKPDLGAVAGVPVRPGATPEGFSQGTPTNTQGQQSPTDIIKKAFGDYNPDVYEYRFGPDGQPQRRKKTK